VNAQSIAMRIDQPSRERSASEHGMIGIANAKTVCQQLLAECVDVFSLRPFFEWNPKLCAYQNEYAVLRRTSSVHTKETHNYAEIISLNYRKSRDLGKPLCTVSSSA
jgi:uncharacterized protein involved in tolerance to divalent cations